MVPVDPGDSGGQKGKTGMYAKILPYDKDSGVIGRESVLVPIDGATTYGTHWGDKPWPSAEDLGYEAAESMGVYGDPTTELNSGLKSDPQMGYSTKWLFHGRTLLLTHGDIYLVGDNGKTIDKVR